jgi:hypothetical protein
MQYSQPISSSILEKWLLPSRCILHQSHALWRIVGRCNPQQMQQTLGGFGVAAFYEY